jgi:hypothetical protein
MIKVILSLLFIFSVMGCQRPESYDAFIEIFEWSDLERLGFEEKRVMVYYYNRDVFGTECPGCNLVRDPLFEFIDAQDGFILHLINERVVSGLRPTGIRSAPTLIFIEKGTVTHHILGAGPILEALNQIEEGTFDLELITLQEDPT